jgi:hypothetical protein
MHVVQIRQIMKLSMYRQVHGYSDRDFAELAGLARSTVYRPPEGEHALLGVDRGDRRRNQRRGHAERPSGVASKAARNT